MTWQKPVDIVAVKQAVQDGKLSLTVLLAGAILLKDKISGEAVLIPYQAEAEKNEPLTLAELREMGGEPAWCVEYQCWGIVKVEKIGRWANKPFLTGSWHTNGLATNFEWDIKKRGLTLYRRKPEEG